MAMTYDPIFAADPNNPSVVASNAAILIYDPADTGKAPLAIADSSGSPLSNPITVNKNGFGPAFQHPTIDRVAWQGGGFEGFFTSYEGMKNAALDAASAASVSAGSAATAAADATAAVNASLSSAVADAEAAQAAATAAANLVGAPADSAIATAINAVGSATKTALSATILDNIETEATTPGGVLAASFGPQSAPPYAPANRLYTFDPARSVYNVKQSNTARLRAKLALARTGTGTCKLQAGPADSMTAGHTSDPATLSWPVLLRKALASAGIPITSSGVVFTTTATPRDSRWVLTGFTDFGNAFNFVQATSIGAKATYTPVAGDPTGSLLDIWILGSGGEVSIKIDGGAAVLWTPPVSGSLTPQIRTFSGLANTTHTIEITTTTASATSVVGVRVYGIPGLEVTNAARSGTKTGDWTNAAQYAIGPCVRTVNGTADGVFIALLHNDFAAGVTVPTYKTNLSAIVDTYKAAGSDVFLTITPRPNPSIIPTATWEAYAQAVYEVADTKDVPIIDVAHRFGSYASAAAQGLMNGDGVHENPAGNATWEALIFHALAA